MAGSYISQSGVGGRAIWTGTTGGATILALNEWHWHSECNVIDTPAFTGAVDATHAYVDHAIGMRRGTCTLTGTWNLNFNPFQAAIMQTGARGTLELDVNVFLQPGTKSVSSDAIIRIWDVDDIADGLCSFVAELTLNYIYQDFSNAAA